MSEKLPGLVRIMLPIVDVRDVAQAHLMALKVKEAAGNRFILYTDCLWIRESAEILNEEFGSFYKIPTNELCYFTVKAYSYYDPSIKLTLPYWGKKFYLQNSKSKQILGIQYKSAKDSIIEMAYKMLETGYVKNKLSRL
jgi:nucleoside-diphosphate-sugar epimerase